MSRRSRRVGRDEVDEDESTAHGLKEDNLIAVENSTASLHHQSSVTTNPTTDEMSLQSSTSEFTIPTVSALSFRNPNPFGKGLVPQESFQKERKTYITKDMLYSSWSGKAPNLDHRCGRRHDDSVLQPSYFSAAKEWEHLASIAAATENKKEDGNSLGSEEDCLKPTQFRFQAAHEGLQATSSAPDGIYNIAPSSSRRKKKKQ